MALNNYRLQSVLGRLLAPRICWKARCLSTGWSNRLPLKWKTLALEMNLAPNSTEPARLRTLTHIQQKAIRITKGLLITAIRIRVATKMWTPCSNYLPSRSTSRQRNRTRLRTRGIVGNYLSKSKCIYSWMNGTFLFLRSFHRWIFCKQEVKLIQLAFYFWNNPNEKSCYSIRSLTELLLNMPGGIPSLNIIH